MDTNAKDVQVQLCHWALSLCEDQFKIPVLAVFDLTVEQTWHLLQTWYKVR